MCISFLGAVSILNGLLLNTVHKRKYSREQLAEILAWAEIWCSIWACNNNAYWFVGNARRGVWYSGMRTVKLGNIMCDCNMLWYMYAVGLAGTERFTWSFRLGDWKGSQFWNQTQKNECMAKIPGEMGTRKGMCLARRVATKHPSRSGALLPWLPWAWVWVYVLWEAALCLTGTKRREKGKKKPQTISPYHFARYQFLLDCTIKALLIDLLIAKQILQVL